MQKTNREQRLYDIDFSAELPQPVPPRDSDGDAVLSEPCGAVCRGGGYTFYTVTVIGQIEGHYLLGAGAKTTKYEKLTPLLVGIEEDDGIDGLLLILNTAGGDVEAGLALAELVASMKKPTVSLVLGGGHSIGVPLAVAAKRSFIVPSATMTLHPVRMSGLVVGVPQTFSYFSKMQQRIFTFIAAHSHAAEACVRELTMRTDDIATDVGTIIDGAEAVQFGIIDSIGGLSEAIGALRAQAKEARAQKETKTESGAR